MDALYAGAEEARGSSMARVWLGQTLAGLGVHEEARDAFQMALVFNPINAQAFRELAKLGKTTRIAGIDVTACLARAIRLFPKGLDGFPTDPWLRTEAQDIYEQQNPDRSIRRRLARAQTHPRDAENLLKLGILYDRTKQKTEADRHLRLAIESAPNDLDLHVRVSELYRDRGQDDQAVKVLEDLASRQQGASRAKALLELGRCFQTRMLANQSSEAPAGRIRELRDRADQAFAEATRVDPTPETFEAAADFCLATRRNEEAVKWLRQALRVHRHTIDERPLRQKLIRALLEIRPLPEDVEHEISEYDARFQGYEEVSLFWGVLHAARGELDKAVQQHTRYLERLLSAGVTAYSRPGELAEAYFLRGELYRRLASVRPGQSTQFLQLAIEDLTRAKVYCPRTLGWHRYATVLATALEHAGRTEEARTELQTALREYPEAADVAQKLIELLGREGRWADQETIIRRQMSAQPKEELWPYLLGEVLERRRALAEAEEAYSQALAISKEGPLTSTGRKAMSALLNVLARRSRFTEMVERVERRVKPEDRDYKMWILYGVALHRINRPQEALTAWVAAANAAGTSDEQGYISRAIQAVLGREAAFQAVRRMCQTHPDSFGATLLLAIMLDQTGHRDEAVKTLEQVRNTTTQPRHRAQLLTYLGTLKTLDNHDQEAVELYRQALAIEEDNTVALNNLAYVLSERLGQPTEALQYARRVAELMPDSVGVIDTLGWCLALTGDYQGAVGVLSRIPSKQRIGPLSYHLAETYRRMKQYDSARQVAEQGLRQAEQSGDKTYQTKLRQLLDQLKEGS